MFGVGSAPDNSRYEDADGGDLGSQILTGIYNLETQGTPNRWMRSQAPGALAQLVGLWLDKQRYRR